MIRNSVALRVKAARRKKKIAEAARIEEERKAEEAVLERKRILREMKEKHAIKLAAQMKKKIIEIYYSLLIMT